MTIKMFRAVALIISLMFVASVGWADTDSGGTGSSNTDSGGTGSSNTDSSNADPSEQGYVKWFNPQKGFGFIEGLDGNDYFVSALSLPSSGFRFLVENQKVDFEATATEKDSKHKIFKFRTPKISPRRRRRRRVKE